MNPEGVMQRPNKRLDSIYAYATAKIAPGLDPGRVSGSTDRSIGVGSVGEVGGGRRGRRGRRKQIMSYELRFQSWM